MSPTRRPDAHSGPGEPPDPALRRFADGGPGNRMAMCVTCRHKELSSPTCAAFPNGIPSDILDGTVAHRAPYPGDRGIRYEPVSE